MQSFEPAWLSDGHTGSSTIPPRPAERSGAAPYHHWIIHGITASESLPHRTPSARLGKRYVAYTRFNVARSGDDGFGRSASDDDVSYAQLWVAFQPSAHAVDVALLVISPSHELGRELEAALSPSCAVTAVRPGAGLLRALRQARPHVVVVDRIDERPEAAQLEIALVKEQYPCARVIALSGNSSDADASTIEQGLFCYVAAPGDDELVRLIHAAARAAETERNGHT